MDAAIEEAVLAARDHFADRLRDINDLYEARCEWRLQNSLPVVAFVGHGRHGKDESAERFAQVTAAEYGSSLSHYVNPLIAWCLNISESESWETRHKCRDYWFKWCNEFRREDPAALCKMLLAKSDLVVGIRAKPEIWEVVKTGVVDHVVWVNRPGFPADPTLEYSEELIFTFPSWRWICNDGDLDKLSHSVHSLAKNLDMYIGEKS